MIATLVLAALVPGVQIDGTWLSADAAVKRGFVVAERVLPDGARRVTLTNRSGKPAYPEELGWRKEGRDEALDVRGLKAYVESWQMVGPCGVRTADDLPFDYSPDYLHNCVSTPADYHPGRRGEFLSDNLCAFRRPDGTTLVMGFTTGKDRFGHFRMKMSADGLDEFYALSACDRAELPPNGTIETESLVLLGGPADESERLFNRFADRWAKDMSARRRFTEPPVGWCSWYYYFDKVTLKDVVANADWFVAHRNGGFDKVKVMQLDDGYQRALGDWLVPNEKFPGGLAAFAKEMKSRGFTPAVWVGPFMVEENSRLFAEHPDWMVKGADGKPASPLGWRDDHKVYVLDATNPAVQEHLAALFRDLRKLGIDYVKLDFCMIAASVKGAVYFDRTATRAQALRRGFEAIRRGFGDDGFILGCGTPFGPLVGIADGMRSSSDITPYWVPDGKWYAEAPAVPNVLRNIINHNYMNGRLWINDPDTLIVRDDSTKLTENEVNLWREAVAMVGGSLLLSDNFTTLSAARLPLVRRALADFGTCSGAYPVDRWESAVPRIWAARKDGRRVKTVFDLNGAHTAERRGAEGEWVVEAGVRKFKVGRTAAACDAEAHEACARPVTDAVVHVDESMTLDEVNEMIVNPGTKVLFKRGGVWRGQLQPRSGRRGHPVVYGAYGEGPKPIIEPSYDRSRPSDWRKEGEGLWSTSTGASADIGNIIFDHGAKGCAFKRNTPEELTGDLDFWCDPKTFAVRLKSEANPATRFRSIELAEKVHCIEESGMHDVVYDGLHLRYTGAHGIGGAGVKRIAIRNCDICWIGGGYLYYDNGGRGVRYGNGIEFWSKAEYVLVESNRVWECWDAGLTNQSSGDGDTQRCLVWRGNEVWNCEYSYEYWQQGLGATTDVVHVENNVFRDAGKGWGHRQRWNPNAAHLMFYDTTAVTRDFVVRGNVFSRSEDCLFRFFNDWRANLDMRDNRWVSGGEPICRYHGRPTANLTYRYPDRLDQIHDDNLAEIESQGAGARVFKVDELDEFLSFVNQTSSNQTIKQ